MPTYALEGTGATISFATSVFTSDLISLTLNEAAREALETTHLGTLVSKTFKPGKLVNVGTISAEFDFNPAANSLISNPAETITITYPLETGQATAARVTFSGFVTGEGGVELKVDALMRIKVTIQISGSITFTAAT